jgi:hypothetical protein
LVWVAVVGREPRAVADAVVKDVEAWSLFRTSVSADRTPAFLPGVVQSVDPSSTAMLPETEESKSLCRFPPVLLPPLSPESLHAL